MGDVRDVLGLAKKESGGHGVPNTATDVLPLAPANSPAQPIQPQASFLFINSIIKKTLSPLKTAKRT